MDGHQASESSVALIALGNVLMQDDGLGPYLLAELDATYDFDGGLSLVDAGTPGLHLCPLLMDYRRVIILDALAADGPPGEIRRIGGDDLLRNTSALALGPHQRGLTEAWGVIELWSDVERALWVVGAIAQRVGPGLGLSPAVRATLGNLQEHVVQLLAAWGIRARRRPTRGSKDTNARGPKAFALVGGRRSPPRKIEYLG